MTSEKSLEEKVFDLSILACKIYDAYDAGEISFENQDDRDFMCAYADGLTQGWFTNIMTGHCSIGAMLLWPIEKVEEKYENDVIRMEKYKSLLSKPA